MMKRYVAIVVFNEGVSFLYEREWPEDEWKIWQSIEEELDKEWLAEKEARLKVK